MGHRQMKGSNLAVTEKPPVLLQQRATVTGEGEEAANNRSSSSCWVKGWSLQRQQKEAGRIADRCQGRSKADFSALYVKKGLAAVQSEHFSPKYT